MEAKDNFVKTYTGRIVCPLALDPWDVDPVDIAHHLSNQCRFTGATEPFYSVAEHSCRVSDLCSPPNRLKGLIHDAPEYLLFDMSRPLKRAKGYALGREYRKVEAAIMEVICQRFDIDAEEPDEVIAADRRLLVTEQRDLMGHEPMAGNVVDQELFASTEPLPITIRPWGQEVAKHEFLDRLEELTGTRIPLRTRAEIQLAGVIGGR